MCPHPYIVRIIDFFNDEEVINIVTPFANQGDLNNIIMKRKYTNDYYTESEILTMATYLLLALRNIHA